MRPLGVAYLFHGMIMVAFPTDNLLKQRRREVGD